jgi:hypothetical protein
MADVYRIFGAEVLIFPKRALGSNEFPTFHRF